MTTPLRRIVHSVRSDKGRVWYHAAYLPEDVPDPKISKDVAIYRHAHVEEGHAVNFGSKSFGLTPYRRSVGDRVVISGWTYEVKRGICERVRLIPEDLLDQIARLDLAIAAKEEEKNREIAALREERAALLEDAYAHGKKLKVSDIVQVKP